MCAYVWPRLWLTVYVDSFDIVLFLYVLASVGVFWCTGVLLCVLMCLARFALFLQSPHAPHLNLLPFTSSSLWFFQVASWLKILRQCAQAISIGVCIILCILFLCFARPALLLQILLHPSASHVNPVVECVIGTCSVFLPGRRRFLLSGSGVLANIRTFPATSFDS